MIYSEKDEYKSRYTTKKGSSEYEERQQGYQDVQRQAMDKKSYHKNRSDNNLRKPSSRSKPLYIWKLEEIR